MRCLKCGICCMETEMLLTDDDIARLESKGFVLNSFAKADKAGYFILKNSGGCCVFFDIEKNRCQIYSDRPAGCRVYPVIYDEDKGVVVDVTCNARKTVTEQEKEQRGRLVIRLLKQIDTEAEKRVKNH